MSVGVWAGNYCRPPAAPSHTPCAGCRTTAPRAMLAAHIASPLFVSKKTNWVGWLVIYSITARHLERAFQTRRRVVIHGPWWWLAGGCADSTCSRSTVPYRLHPVRIIRMLKGCSKWCWVIKPHQNWTPCPWNGVQSPVVTGEGAAA